MLQHLLLPCTPQGTLSVLCSADTPDFQVQGAHAEHTVYVRVACGAIACLHA